MALLIIKLLILIPITGLIISILIPRKRESLISWIAYVTVSLNLLSFIVLMVLWLMDHHPTLNLKDIVLLTVAGYEFFIDFYFDKISAIYFFVGTFLTFMVTVYSRSYLHRERGFKRFFNTILFFYLGYVTVILSGNLETLFIGWEILGISSFLLIAFYRYRYLPVKNAVKVFSIYRIGDIGIILAMWMSHHLWHENITFLKLSNYELVHSQLQTHSVIGIFISLMILVSAAVKSAQLPFSSWLPRAMEGPTPSSAIFYGSLSVHLGVFLLLRTFPFWEHQISVRILIAVVGLLTSIIATGTARVQSNIKSQIAYASIAQIGLMFVEIAAGFETLALIHFSGNAFLRTYQLLVSPSVVSYLIKEQFFNFIPRPLTFEDSLPKKIESSFYILCLKEWNLDSFMYYYLWTPLKRVGNMLNFVTFKFLLIFFIPLYAVCLYYLYNQSTIPVQTLKYLPYLFSFIGLIMALKSFVKRYDAVLTWILIIMSHFWIALSISFNEHFHFDHAHLYLSGIVVSGFLGYWCLNKLKSFENNVDLDQFHGYSYKHPRIAFIFLLSCLGLAGFPITPTFIGEDLILTHIHENQAVLAFIISLSFIVIGISVIRIYARIFLGPHIKSLDEMANRSA